MMATSFQLVVLDDDPWLRESWQLRAEIAGVTLGCFANPAELFAKLEYVDKETPIFVDYDLSDRMNGLQVLSQLALIGYRNLHLASGMCSFADSQEKFPFRVTSKEFPENLFLI